MPAPAASKSNTTSRPVQACTTASTSARCWKWYRSGERVTAGSPGSPSRRIRRPCGRYALRQDLAAQNRRRFYPKWPARRMAAPCGSIGGQRVRAELDLREGVLDKYLYANAKRLFARRAS